MKSLKVEAKAQAQSAQSRQVQPSGWGLYAVAGSGQQELMKTFPGGDRYLFVQRIAEPTPHSLSVVVAEGKILPHEEPVVPTALKARQIKVDSESLFIDIRWNNVLSYLVLDESYTSVGPTVGDNGKPLSMLETIENSAFIAYLQQISFANNDYPGPLMHYRLCSLTHIIDVISTDPPAFRQIVGS